MADSSESGGETVKTKILIISDTHGLQPPTESPETNKTARSKLQLHGHPLPAKPPFYPPLPSADVAIHCGDLTKRSMIDEYHATFEMLRKIDAPLKIVIAGNHDLALDPDYYRDHAHQYKKSRLDKRDWYAKSTRVQDEALSIVNGSKDKGVYFIDEGVHTFKLQNGGRLKVYASPWTPVFGGWAFQYDRGKHRFDIPSDVDFAVTHGPPMGMQDYAWDGSRAGCPDLFQAIYRSRPRVHCFGHIHEGWGAYRAEWKQPGEKEPLTYLSAVDEARSTSLENNSTLKLSGFDTKATKEEKTARYAKYAEAGYCEADITPEGDAAVEKGKQTLFVNAAVLDERYRIANFPWMVDIDLPRVAR